MSPEAEALLRQLDAAGDPAARRAVLRRIAAAGGPAAAEVFRRLLTSSEDEVERSTAAAGLRALGTEDALEATVRTLDDAPDPLHFDATASVKALSKMGLAGARAVLPLLSAPDPRTRRRAEKVLRATAFDQVRRRVRPRPLSNAAQEAFAALWEENGAYHWDAPEEAREASLRRWRAWLGAQGEPS